MHSSTSTALLVLSASVVSAFPVGRDIHQLQTRSQEPFKFPLADNFPNPDPGAENVIEVLAGGTLSDAPPPPFPGQDGITNLQLIAFNELFEVAFFTELLLNITNNVPGYQEGDGVNDFAIDALIAIRAQEELHVLNANGALKHFNVTPIEPCEYIFPVEDFPSAIALAGTFTDLVLGTLQDVEQIFASLNASGLVRGVASVIGQEGEQEGFYRALQFKLPSSSPFLTTSTRDFAFTALQGFTVNGSCPSLSQIPLKIFGGLNVDNAADLGNKNGTAEFSVDPSQGKIDSSSSVVYISGQNLPVTVPLTDFAEENGVATFKAFFPFEGGALGAGAFSKGLTLAAVVAGSPQFASADAVAEVAVFGPGIIEVD